MQQDEKEQILRELQLAFMGKILAGVTHELKNYLAIIRESSGLIQDLIEMGKSPRKKEGEQYQSSLQLIDGQVERSITALNYLNRFAHRMDQPVSSFDMNDALEELTALIQRDANRKRISLQKNFQEGLPSITGSPSKLQFLCFCLLDEKLRSLEAGSKILLRTSSNPDSVRIGLLATGNRNPEHDGKTLLSPELLRDVTGQLGAELQQSSNGQEITLSIPLTI